MRFNPEASSLKKVNSAFISEHVLCLQLQNEFVAWHDKKDVVIWNWNDDTWITLPGLIRNEVRCDYSIHDLCNLAEVLT
jgi:hypothetical protein